MKRGRRENSCGNTILRDFGRDLGICSTASPRFKRRPDSLGRSIPHENAQPQVIGVEDSKEQEVLAPLSCTNEVKATHTRAALYSMERLLRRRLRPTAKPLGNFQEDPRDPYFDRLFQVCSHTDHAGHAAGHKI